MSYTFQVEPWAGVEDSIRALTEAHWREIAIDKDRVPLSIQWKKYAAMDAEGSLHITTARHNGELIGYIWSQIIFPLQYGTTLHGMMGGFFVHPGHRKSSVGLRLFETMEDDMKLRHVRVLVGESKANFDLSALFEYLGWDLMGPKFRKWIGLPEDRS